MSHKVASPILEIPYAFSRQQGIFLDTATQKVHCQSPVSHLALAELQRCLGTLPEVVIDSPEVFNRLLQKHHEASASGTMHNIDGMDEVLDLNSIANALNEPEDILEHSNDAPVIKLLNALITEAVREEASDIHIEQYEDRLRIRFRIDGALREILEPDAKLAPLIISRIKVMAKLDIAEKRLPQDGRISIKIGGRPVDVRVSTIPTGNGFERVVMRLLNKETGKLDLDYLGMPDHIKSSVNTILKKPHGILLVTGPTGSGKTTTLYAMLSELNNKERNIMTVEDPIEYYLDGINQSQVNAKIGMTFASGLRSILRQDPDVIMLGEIRDHETAQIAIQASLTGHVVFSTLHTNTSIGAITRLRDMGVEPFLLASSVSGVLAQRLVRTLCPECKQAKVTDKTEKDLLQIKEDMTIYQAHGCSQCKHTGYRGRQGLFDFFAIDNTIQEMIHAEASEHTMTEYIRQSSPSLIASGIALVRAGQTTIEEIVRVSGVTDNA